MKSIFYTGDTPANKISYFLLVIFVVTLPFDRIFSELALIGLAVHTLLLHPADRPFSFRWIGWLVAGIYLLGIAGVFYSEKPSLAFGVWEKQLALILFPLIIWFSRLDLGAVRDRILLAFAYSCLFTLIYLYYTALHEIYDQRLPIGALLSPRYMNHAFSAPIDLHATYFSLYIAMSFLTFVVYAIRTPMVFRRLVYLLCSAVLLAGLFQLASRAVCVGVLVLINFILPWFLLRKRRPAVISVCLGITCLMGMGISRDAALHTRYLRQFRMDLMTDTGAVDDPEPRMARWRCAVELIRASPWIGYGTGDETPRLKQRYFEHHLMDAYKFNLNAHNQYLSQWLNTGVIGFVLYSLLLAAGGLAAIRRRDPWLAGFVLLIGCVSFSENILDVNKGIFFFSLFFVLLVPPPAYDLQRREISKRFFIIRREKYGEKYTQL